MSDCRDVAGAESFRQESCVVRLNDGTRFTLISPIGSGGQGTVHQARMEPSGKIVAVKGIQCLTAELCRQIERAVSVLQRVGTHCRYVNPAIACGLDEERGVFWLVYELIDGGSLRDVRERQDQCELVDILDWGEQLALALSAVHANGVVHRDVKPANVMIEDSTKEIRLIDFELARDLEATDTSQSRGNPGTTRYKAPELVRKMNRTRANALSDVWALGVVLWELVTGVRFFGAISDPGELTGAILDRRIRDVRCYRPVSRQLARVIRRCLARDPSRRFQSAGAVVGALSQCRTDTLRKRSNVSLGIDRFAGRCRRLMDRTIDATTYFQVSAAGVVALLLVFAGCLWGVQAQRSQSQHMKSALKRAMQGFLESRDCLATGWHESTELSQSTRIETNLWLDDPTHRLYIEVDEFELNGQQATFTIRATGSAKAQACVRIHDFPTLCAADARLEMAIQGTASVKDGAFADCELNDLDYHVNEFRFVDRSAQLNVISPLVAQALNSYLDSRKREFLSSLARDINGFRFVSETTNGQQAKVTRAAAKTELLAANGYLFSRTANPLGLTGGMVRLLTTPERPKNPRRASARR